MKTIESSETKVRVEKKFRKIKVRFNPCSALKHLGKTPTDEEMFERLSSKPGMMKF